MDNLKKAILAAIEEALTEAINAKAAAVVDAALDALAKAIPGQWDDALINQAKPQVEAAVKAELLKLVAGLSNV